MIRMELSELKVKLTSPSGSLIEVTRQEVPGRVGGTPHARTVSGEAPQDELGEACRKFVEIEAAVQEILKGRKSHDRSRRRSR